VGSLVAGSDGDGGGDGRRGMTRDGSIAGISFWHGVW